MTENALARVTSRRNVLADLEMARHAQNQFGKQVRAFKFPRPLVGGEKLQLGPGSYATEKLAAEYLPDGTIGVFPTVWMTETGPVELPLEQAIDMIFRYEQETGQKFPRFPTIDAAIKASQSRSPSGGVANGPLAQ